MGSSGPSGPTPEQLEIERMQKEQLEQQKKEAERLEREQKAMQEAKRRGGMGGLLTGDSSGTSGGYKNLLG